MVHREYNQDSKCSREAFAAFVAPYLREKHGLESIEPAENSGNKMFELMDMQSGIDYFVVNCKGSGKVQTIASRVRWFETWEMARYYNEITIRLSRPSGNETEWPKILKAITVGDGYPTYYCNAYFWGVKGSMDLVLARVCTARTKQLYELCAIDLAREHPLMVTKEKYNKDGTTFFGVNMDMYAQAKEGTLYEPNEITKRLNLLYEKYPHDKNMKLII